MIPRFFPTPAAFRAWLERHHDRETEIWVRFYKVKSGKGGMVYREALDQALCYGWIDSVLRRVDEDSYAQRFTPRKKGSNWSLVNIKRATELIEDGLMQPPGRAAFEQRDERKAAAHSFERQHVRMAPAYARALRDNAAAFAFFRAQPPSYRQVATWWIMSAKKPETRERRLLTLIRDSAAGRRVGVVTPGQP